MKSSGTPERPHKFVGCSPPHTPIRAAMLRTLQLSLALLLGVSTTTTQADDSPWRELEGVFAIGGPAIGDVPPENRAARTHIRFGVFGEAAAEMWNMIEAPAVFDACGEDHMTKRSGAIECGYYESNDRYECYFGVGVTENNVVRGVMC